MTAQLTLRAILLHNQSGESHSLPAYRLLADLGHEVAETVSAETALAMLRRDGADLLVVDADRPEQRAVVNRLGDLPEDHQPRHVAIFSDTLDEALSSLPHTLSHSRVHVLLKPLHMHRLLGVLRRLEAKA